MRTSPTCEPSCTDAEMEGYWHGQCPYGPGRDGICQESCRDSHVSSATVTLTLTVTASVTAATPPWLRQPSLLTLMLTQESVVIPSRLLGYATCQLR